VKLVAPVTPKDDIFEAARMRRTVISPRIWMQKPMARQPHLTRQAAELAEQM
jgi:hypothetical protein